MAEIQVEKLDCDKIRLFYIVIWSGIVVIILRYTVYKTWKVKYVILELIRFKQALCEFVRVMFFTFPDSLHRIVHVCNLYKFQLKLQNRLKLLIYI